MNPLNKLTGELEKQTLLFTILRVAIGWHFFWEGWIKLCNPVWTAAGYLKGSWGPLSPIMQGMANLTVEHTWILNWFTSKTNADYTWMLGIINIAMPWMLLLAGLGLMSGFMTRHSIWLAMGLLVMFISATPAYETMLTPSIEKWKDVEAALSQAQWAGQHVKGTEGSYFLVTKNVVEFIALAALLTMNLKNLYGVDYWLHSNVQVEMPDKLHDSALPGDESEKNLI